MREITVTYQFSEEYEKRLQKIREKYIQVGLNLSEDKLFEFIMITGSVYDIDSKFRFHERMLVLMRERLSGNT